MPLVYNRVKRLIKCINCVPLGCGGAANILRACLFEIAARLSLVFESCAKGLPKCADAFDNSSLHGGFVEIS